MTHDPVPEIDFVAASSRRRRRARVAVLALEGAARTEFASAFALASRFDRTPLLVAVDGGLTTCRAMRKTPDLFVGDGDSAPALPRDTPSIIYPVAKDFSDFSGALGEARRLGAEVAVIAGLLGGRLDHEWANVFTAGEAASRFVGILAPTARGTIAVTAFGLRARGVAGRLVSVFALGRRPSLAHSYGIFASASRGAVPTGGVD